MRKLLVAVAWTLLSSTAFAQSTGNINGTVTDSSGAAIPGVKVTATSPELQGEQVFTTNEQGGYRFVNIPIGEYKVQFESAGFGTVIREKIGITIGFTATVNVTLNPASQQQTVQVSAEAPLVDTQNSNVANTFGSQQLQEVPNARDMWAVVAVTPGMAATTIDIGGSNAGTQSNYTAYGYGNTSSFAQNRVQVDGVNTTEGTGSAGFYYDYGSFAEFNISTAANDASMPVPGSQVNAVIKTGSNSIHGQIYQDYESPSFQGTNITQSQLKQGVSGQYLTKYHDTNGDIGGPILRDKLWYYVSLRDLETGRSVTGFPVEAPGTIPSVADDRNITYKFSYQISQNHRLSTYLQWGQAYKPQRAATSTTYGDYVYKQNSFSWAGNVDYTGTLTPKLVVDLRAGTFGYNFPMNPTADPDGTIAIQKSEVVSGDLQGGYNKGRTDRRRYQWDTTVSYFLDHFMGGAHQIKVGQLWEREETIAHQYGPVQNIQEIFNSVGKGKDFQTPYQVTLYSNPTIAKDFLLHQGAYIQDQVRVGKRITLNLGARWDYYRQYENDNPVRPDVTYLGFFFQGQPLGNNVTVPVRFPNLVVPGRQVVRYPFLIVPRLGIAYDLFGDGKTVVKANWGRFYASPGNVLGGYVNPLSQLSYTFQWNNPTNAPFNINQLGNFVSNAGGTPTTVAPGIKAPIYEDTSLTIEHQIGNSWNVRGGFFYRTLKNNWQRVDVGRPSSAYTLPVTKTDPGPDGVAGTSDDQAVTVYDIPKSAAGTVPATVIQVQTPDGTSEYFRSAEFTTTKRLSSRFSLLATFTVTSSSYPYQRGNSVAAGYTGAPYNPNMLLNSYVHGVYTWNSHITGTYQAKWGFNITPVYRMQSGTPLERIYSFTGLNVGTVTVPVQPTGTYRSDDIYVADIRVTRDFKFKERYKIGGIFDLFNIFNTNASNTQDANTGLKTAIVNGVSNQYARFLAPTQVLAPRIARIGVRFTF